jgi:hypothetical protein
MTILARLNGTSDRVVIGMDPHKRSATIEVMTGEGVIVGAGGFGTDRDGYRAMLQYAKRCPVIDDEQLPVLRILVDRRRSLGEDHTRMISQLHRLLLELIPGRAKKDLSAAQAKALLARVRPRAAAGKARRRVAAELIADLDRIYQRKKAADKELKALVAATHRRTRLLRSEEGRRQDLQRGPVHGHRALSADDGSVAMVFRDDTLVLVVALDVSSGGASSPCRQSHTSLIDTGRISDSAGSRSAPCHSRPALPSVG